jgi:hypothetical protein
MRNFLRFLFKGDDVTKISAQLQVEDVTSLAAPPAGSPAPGSLKLGFRQSDPAPIEIKPLFPGSMHFLVDANAAGVLPTAAEVDFTSAAYSGWKTLGRLLIIIEDKNVSDELSRLVPNLVVKPNRIWYGPVRITENFLFNTLRSDLRKAHMRSADGRTIRTDNPNWAKHAVAEFLAGRYHPILHLGNDANQDDVIRFVMPSVEVPDSGEIELFITTALAQKPQDGPDRDFDDPANPVSRDEPLHPRNGLIPAREVYRQLRVSMVDDAPSEPLRNAILADWPNQPRFFAIQFTRTWERNSNCSAHFTRHTAHVQQGANTLMEQRLPAHGVLFLRQEPSNPLPAPPNTQVSLVGGDMTWLLGGGTSWRDQGQTVPIGIDLGAVAQPHISVRLPMTKAMVSDITRPAPEGPRCTYLSFRRFVRALVDNRIAGGRLNNGLNFTSAETRGIIQRAFAGTGASVNLVANNAPRVDGNPDLALSLVPILRAFFPNNTPQQPIPGAPANSTIYTQGEMAYRLWQSILDNFEENRTKRNFSDAHIGRGGPGTAVTLGLATYHVDPARNLGEVDAAYFDRIVAAMLVGLEPGTLLQFWRFNSDYENIKARNTGGGLPEPHGEHYGHSPIFVDYMRDGAGNVTGIDVIDQFGVSHVPVTGGIGARRLNWAHDEEIWIAANWDE